MAKQNRHVNRDMNYYSIFENVITNCFLYFFKHYKRN